MSCHETGYKKDMKRTVIIVECCSQTVTNNSSSYLPTLPETCSVLYVV